jgi:eukaryotic-like serine/threonine-protein kinase
MALAPGARLGPYAISASIGAGGMGEVYRATDTTLGRQVAIKILPDAFASDPERLARFEREAKTLASLNHPNIAQIYGFEKSNDLHALVMELVEGPTLADRIERGPIPVDEALPIAKQIAEALEAAHGQGIIHRDLKPANIKVRPDGIVKVLDFGLAKLAETGGTAAANSVMMSNSPTITSPALMTGVGMLLGTASYMSPDQAKGRSVDKRADVWAFGCVLYEMLTGRRAFAGDDVSDTLANVLKTQPDWNALPQETPLSIRRLLRRCLEKDPKRRLHDIADACLEIDDAQSGSIETGLAGSTTSNFRQRLAWVVAGLGALIAVVATVWAARTSSLDSLPEMHVDIVTPETSDPVSLALSPDGRQLVFAAVLAGRPSLWLRTLNSATERRLEGTDGARYPFWSPDSASVGFFADNRLKTVDVSTGAVKVLVNATPGRGGTWNRDGVILYSSAQNQTLFRISAAGGERVAGVTRLEGQQSGHCFPQFLPDGRHFFFYAEGPPEAKGVYLGELDGSGPRRLIDADSVPVYVSGRLLFVRQGSLVRSRR